MFIVDGKAFDNLLAVSGHAKHVKQGHRTRTITLREALVRFGQLNPPFQITPDLNLVIDARDGSAHAAERPEDLDRILHAALRTARALLQALGRDEAKFWRRYSSTVVAILAKHTDAVRAAVKLRIAEAGRTYAERFKGIDDDQLHMLKVAIEATQASTAPDESCEEDCPACENIGLLIGYTEMEWQTEVGYDPDTGEEYLLDVDGQLHLHPIQFRCPFCQLALNNEEELAIADLAEPRELRHANPDELRGYHDKEYGYE